MCLLHSKGQSLRYSPEQHNSHSALWLCGGGRGPRGNNAAYLTLGRLSVTSPATHKQIGPFWYWFLGGWVCVCSRTLWVWEFLPPPELPQVFTLRGFEALFPRAGTLGCVVYLAPQLFLPVCPHANVGLRGLPATAFHPGCQSAPLLPVWVNVSSLTPWLLGFYTVQFSSSSGYFLFLNLLLSFWLCQEAKCYLLTPPS